jgi:phosphate transport system substrate-binding protein
MDQVKSIAGKEIAGYSLEVLGGTETGGGVDAVLEGLLDVAVMCRMPKEEELTQGLAYSKIGMSPIALFTHADVGITSLAKGQIAQIFSGRVTNWSELGGPDVPIVVYVLDENKPGTKLLRNAIFGDTPFAETAQTFTSPGAILSSVEKTPGSIGYGSWSSALAMKKTLQPIALEDVMPTDTAYSIKTPFGLGYLAERESEVQPLIDWLLSEHGQDLLQQYSVTSTK